MHNFSLFRLPAPRKFSPTREQLALMDLIALRDGRALGMLTNGARVTLRRLIAKELVEVRGSAPAIYLLTPVGRLVRERNSPKRSAQHVIESSLA